VPDWISAADEYGSLRDETLKRVEFRNNLFNFTIITAGTIVTVGTSEKLPIALLAYPILILFFAASFSYNTMLLIAIGSYLREKEAASHCPGWASYLMPRYGPMEHLERLAKYGLFVLTPALMLAFAWLKYRSGFDRVEYAVMIAGLIAIVLTIVVLLWPEIYHSKTLAQVASVPKASGAPGPPDR
jgi:cytochrome bd-type quinol oxidase subunit 2